ncbi:hypothetical protein [Rhizohabitans arisaemae]|uniref:hypothetical protein n=1 Tax=Rhizohabitans arisaemae TaxID=2720610 RepID=UPI0024B0E84C|nr:hypothetical protein [Rhizohabitans arisaemae]
MPEKTTVSPRGTARTSPAGRPPRQMTLPSVSIFRRSPMYPWMRIDVKPLEATRQSGRSEVVEAE